MQGCPGIVLADMNEKAGQETLEIVKKLGTKAVFLKTDVSKAADLERVRCLPACAVVSRALSAHVCCVIRP